MIIKLPLKYQNMVDEARGLKVRTSNDTPSNIHPPLVFYKLN